MLAPDGNGERMSIQQYLTDRAFGPDEIEALSWALDGVCNALNVNGDKKLRGEIAARIIELAARGERSPQVLCDRVLSEGQGQPDA
jgi:hypothetical protein